MNAAAGGAGSAPAPASPPAPPSTAAPGAAAAGRTTALEAPRGSESYRDRAYADPKRYGFFQDATKVLEPRPPAPPVRASSGGGGPSDPSTRMTFVGDASILSLSDHEEYRRAAAAYDAAAADRDRDRVAAATVPNARAGPRLRVDPAPAYGRARAGGPLRAAPPPPAPATPWVSPDGRRAAPRGAADEVLLRPRRSSRDHGSGSSASAALGDVPLVGPASARPRQARLVRPPVPFRAARKVASRVTGVTGLLSGKRRQSDAY